MALVGDKVKLTNYVSYLSNDGKRIEQTTNGTRGESEMVIDSFDIDWRPYRITYGFNVETTTIDGNTVTVATIPDYETREALAEQGLISYANIQYTYQVLDMIGLAYTRGMVGHSYEGHYDPQFGFPYVEEWSGTGQHISDRDENRFVHTVAVDGKGHVIATEVSYMGTEDGVYKTDGPLTFNGIPQNASSGGTMSYVTGTYFFNGVLSYSYSEVRHTQYCATDGDSNYNPAGVVTNISITKSGHITYVVSDISQDSGNFNAYSQIYWNTENYPNYPEVITGISVDNYGNLSYSYDKLYLRLPGGTGSSDFITGVELHSDGTMIVDEGQFTNTDNGSATKNSPSYICNVNLNHDGTFSYEWANINHDVDPSEGSQINLTYEPTSTASTKFVTGVSISVDGVLSYTYSAVKVENADTAGGLTYLVGTEIDAQSNPGSHLVEDITLGQNGILNFTYRSLATSTSDDVVHGSNSTITNTATQDVIVGINQYANGKISYQYVTLNTDHSTSPIPKATVQNHVITDVYLNRDGELSYNYRDISVRQGMTNCDLASNGDDFRLANSTNNRLRVITNITQEPDGQISYTYNNIYTTHSTTEFNGDFIYDIELSADGVLMPSAKTFGADNGTAVNVHVPESGEHYGTAYIIGGTITSDGHFAYTYSYIYHTTSKTDGGARTLTSAGFDIITGVNIDIDGNLTYNYNTVAIGNAEEAETLTYLEYNNYLSMISNKPFDATYVVTYVWKDPNNFDRVTVTYTDLSTDLEYLDDHNVHSEITIGNSYIQLISNIHQLSNGKLTYSYNLYNTFRTNTGTEIVSPASHVLTNAHIDAEGNFTYNYRDIQSTINSGNYVAVPEAALTTTIPGQHITRLVNSSTPKGVRVMTGISQTSDGQISYTYTYLYTNAETNYKFHEITINDTIPNTVAANVDSDYVTVMTGFSTVEGNYENHLLSYETVEVPSKKYIDNSIKANDAARYCGTFSGNNGALVLQHTEHYGPAHGTTPDTDCGAMYKYIGTETTVIDGIEIQPGTTIMSYSDSATANGLVNWNVFQANINIVSDGTSSTNGDNSKRVLTNVYINDSGLLSYNYSDLNATTNAAGNASSVIKTAGTSENINSSSTGTVSGTEVITGVSISQNGMETVLSYSFGKIYADTNHHSTANVTVPANGNYVLGAVHLSGDGELTYSYTRIDASGMHYDTNSTNTAGNSGQYTIPSNGTTSSGTDTVVAFTYVDDLGHIITYNNVHLIHGLVTGNPDVTYNYSSENKVILGVKLNQTGHVHSVDYGFVPDNINNHYSTNGVATTIGSSSSAITIPSAGAVSSEVVTGQTTETKGHVTSHTAGTLQHGLVLANDTLTTYTSTGKAITGINVNATGHIASVDYGVIDTNLVKYEVNDSIKIYVGGASKVSSGDPLTYLYTNTAYFQGDALYSPTVNTDTLSVSGNTTLGDAHTDTITLNAKTVTIADDSDHNKLEFNNLNLLWGSLS